MISEVVCFALPYSVCVYRVIRNSFPDLETEEAATFPMEEPELEVCSDFGVVGRVKL